MEKKVGIISILITNRDIVPEVNELISSFAEIIISRFGLPMPEDSIFIICLTVKSFPDTINAFTGKIGKIKGVNAKLNLVKTV